MIKRILRIAKQYKEVLARRGDSTIDEIVITIRFPISVQAGFRPDKPRGSAKMEVVRWDKGPYNPEQHHNPFYADVFDSFSLTGLIRDYEEGVKRQLASTKEWDAFEVGTTVEFTYPDDWDADDLGPLFPLRGTKGVIKEVYGNEIRVDVAVPYQTIVNLKRTGLGVTHETITTTRGYLKVL